MNRCSLLAAAPHDGCSLALQPGTRRMGHEVPKLQLPEAPWQLRQTQINAELIKMSCFNFVHTNQNILIRGDPNKNKIFLSDSPNKIFWQNQNFPTENFDFCKNCIFQQKGLTDKSQPATSSKCLRAFSYIQPPSELSHAT